MEKKNNFWDNTLFGFAVKNILIAGFLILAFTVISLFLLKIYTKHGQSETVPALRGLSIEEAVNMIERHNLDYEIIDSVFVRDKKLGSIIEQNPAPNTIVKPGRSIYLIINSKAIRQIPLPDLRDLSLRQAEAMVKSLGIRVANIQYAPSEYKDLILDAKYNGQSLSPGAKIPEGGAIVLVAGSGVGQLAVGVVPNLVGLDINTASNLISATSLILGGVIYDVSPSGNEQEYKIFRQSPVVGDSIAPGTIIDIWLSKDPVQAKEDFVQPRPPRREEKKEKVNDIEEFF